MPGALRAPGLLLYVLKRNKTEAKRKIDTTSKVAWKGDVSSAVITVPNIISFIRLLLIPVFFILLINGHTTWATIFFLIASSTDWVDGYVARKTNSVSKLGRILDPAADRLLMIFSVVGLMLVGLLPSWVMILILIRDLIMLFGYYVMLKKFDVRVDVIFAGKVATALLYLGMFGLLLGWPLSPGLGITEFSWLPGFTSEAVSWGIWPVYAGVLLGIFTTAYYAIIGLLACHEVTLDHERSA